MKTRRFPFDRGGPERLRLQWQGKTVEVLVDGASIAKTSERALALGERLALPDGSSLELKLSKTPFAAGLDVSRDGVPLPGSPRDPGTRVREAALAMFFVAGVTALAAALSLVGLSILGLDAWSFLDTAIFGVLGFFTLRGSRVAVVLGTVLFAVGSLYTLAANVAGFHIGGLIVRVVILVTMVRAVPAAWSLARRPDSSD